MPKQPSNLNQTREPGQYSLDLPNYLVRIIPQWGQPDWFIANYWRSFVRAQPVAVACKEFLVSSYCSLDWVIAAKDDKQRDELKSDIQTYTDLFNHLGGLDYVGYVEWIAGDLLDLPFGAASEIGRVGDQPGGDVVWVLPLDAATLFPTLREDFPVGQRLLDAPYQTVYFPAHAINRVYFSPRSEIRREGYGMAPPEKIYLAMVSLGRGDQYYANLLLDTPEAGILDLADMSKESALEWVNSFRSLLTGIDPFKIPVLYEHTNPINWIPFVQPPTNLMFDKITLKYSALVCSGYGTSLSDIGLSGSTTGGDTLAGSIREERKGRHTGLGRLKKKMKAHFDAMLPPTLEYHTIDYDDERALTLGRARMANATAFAQMITGRYIAPQEARSQLIADGLFTIPMSETIPEKELPEIQPAGFSPSRDRQIGFNQSPSLGGHGDITAQRAQYLPDMKGRQQLEYTLKESFDRMMKKAHGDRLERLVRKAIRLVYPQISQINQNLTEEEKGVWRAWYEDVLNGHEKEVEPVILEALGDFDSEMDKELEDEGDWWKTDLSVAALMAIFLGSYQEAIQQAAHQMAHNLFVEGLIDSPEIIQPFRVQNETIKEHLTELATALAINLTSGNSYFIRRAILSKVKEALTSDPDVVGVDIDTIIANNVFMGRLLLDIEEELARRLQDRAEIDAEFEIGNLENLAIAEEYQRSGLTLKHWVCYGPDPCEICIENQSHGYVPLDFVFKGVYESIKSPKAHTHCYCGLEYNTEELRQTFENGEFNLWYGE